MISYHLSSMASHATSTITRHIFIYPLLPKKITHLLIATGFRKYIKYQTNYAPPSLINYPTPYFTKKKCHSLISIPKIIYYLKQHLHSIMPTIYTRCSKYIPGAITSCTPWKLCENNKATDLSTSIIRAWKTIHTEYILEYI